MQKIHCLSVAHIQLMESIAITAPGETVTIAEEMAARDALRRTFNMGISQSPFKLGHKGHTFQVENGNPNMSLSDYAKAHLS